VVSDNDIIDSAPGGGAPEPEHTSTEAKEKSDKTADGGFHMRRFAAVAGILLALIPLTWFAQILYVDYVAERAEDLQRQAVTDALDEIEARFEDMQDEMLGRARQIANTPAVVHGLRVRSRTQILEGPLEVIDFFAELDVERNMSIELYDFTHRLVAWNGFSMPLDNAPLSQQFFESFQAAIATDARLRDALVVWWPVREGTRILGAVRVMRLIGYDAPVRNEYLRDISLADRWARLTHLPVDVSFESASVTAGETRPRSSLLRGADGTVLGRVVVDPPSTADLVNAAETRFNDVLALWMVLVLLWFVVGAWHIYQNAAHRPSSHPGRFWTQAGWFAAAAFLWWGTRITLLFLNVPARWQQGKTPFAPLFDPTHFASGFGGGLMRSTGDFLISSIFLLVFAAAVAHFAGGFREIGVDHLRFRSQIRRRPHSYSSYAAPAGAVFSGALFIAGLTVVLALATRRAVLDSTFDYFARKGLLPEPLLLIAFCSLILTTIGVILISVCIVWMALRLVERRWPGDLAKPGVWLAIALTAVAPLLILYTFTPIGGIVAWPVALSILTVAFAIAIFLMHRQDPILDFLILRSILPSIFIVTVLLYPLLYNGMDAKRRVQMSDAAEMFSEGRDPRILFAIEQILQEIQMDEEVFLLIGQADGRASLDSLAMTRLRGSLLSSLPAYDVSLTFFSQGGAPVGRYYDTGQTLDSRSLDQIDHLEFEILRQMYEEDGASGLMVELVTGRREPDRFQYEGIAPVQTEDGTELLGWAMVRAEPQTVLREAGTPFPRVLLPSGSYDDLHTNLSVAEFRDGLLVRSIGRDFGRYRLAPDVMLAIAAESELWLTEEVEERGYQTYYRRQKAQISLEDARPILPSAATSIIAVRVPSVNTFDHLYYLLRLTVSGLLTVLPLYVLGLMLRYRAGLLPAPRVRFRDKVLNAFLGVGIISVAAVGYVGLKVITGENERAVQSWLRQHLERVEETLALDTKADEMPYRVLERVRVDSLAARVGLDINVYQDHRLSALSRPQLVRERLIDQRLPIEAYKALYFDGYRFVYTDEQVGNFMYTTGFRALPDEQGRPQFVISVPTLPEQERIEEERARTVAYLFGALLLLVIVVMITASLLANALSRPIARVRSGLQAVAAGRFERMIPVDSRDEIGELVQTFNEMQEQLAESRRKLTQQERQLAWREMARQVAHEIKNPLTPMKLSVQHLRRAFGADGISPEQQAKFKGLFERITTTLIEQIDTLARIANEFQTFARMPSKIVEKLDLNAVVEEAVSLMQEESDVDIVMNLCSEKLIINADREEMRRDYINLIKNAIQAIPEERDGRIEVRTRLEPVDHEDGRAWAYSEVSDNGSGVEEAVRDKIFDPNFSTKTSGTGLGLAIVRKSVEEHHGDIGFTTELGEGSTFWIRFPIVDDERVLGAAQARADTNHPG
jgi:signal transduction histidine kinase